MTEENRKLLLVDLCGRLPYKPIVHAKWSYRETNGKLKSNEADRKLDINDLYAIWDIKPYLRSLSSMTEEEEEEYDAFFNTDYGYMDASKVFDVSDWMYARHFDYRGLIEKGLALEAPEGMYKEDKK